MNKSGISDDVPNAKRIEERRRIHELSQPFNVILLTVANVRNFLEARLAGPDADYTLKKLDRIEDQIERARKLMVSFIKDEKAEI